MKILAINGSPHGKHGNTDAMLQSLLQGMQDAGAMTETVYLNQLSIKHCIGCVNCWFKTPGKCIHNDDMAALLEKRKAADLLICATPLYVFSMTGLMKDFLDRSLPLVLPDFVKNTNGNNLTTHPKRYQRTTAQKLLLVASCAFPEESHFSPLIETLKHIAAEGNLEYLGEVIKTSAGLFKEKSMQPKMTAYCDNLRIAGKQLILNGKIDASLASKLRESWMSDEELRTLTNKRFKAILEQENS